MAARRWLAVLVAGAFITPLAFVAGSYPGADQDRLDGLTVDLGDWWFNLRPSNTEPLLRLNLEAADAEGITGTSE